MVDNVGVTPGSGAVFATDDIGGIQYPRVKVTQGADGASVDVSAAAPLQVTLANGTVPSHAVTNAGTFASQENGAALTALQLIDDTVTAQSTALGTTKTSLMGGSVTTASPTYTTGNINPLSLDTAGNLRVNVVAGGGAGGTSSTVGSAAPSTATAIGFTDGTNMQLGVIKPASTAPVATDRAIVVGISPNSQNANGQTTMANSTPVAIASDQTWGVGSVGFTKLEDAASADGDKGVPMLVVRADTPANSSGTNGDYEFPTIKDGLLWTRLGAGTTGGLSFNSYLIASGTNATSVKASAGQIYKIEIFNNSANIGYLKIYNTASAPTAGSGTPVIRMMVPGNATGAGAISTTDLGLTMSTGIGFTFTGGIADADTTSVAASAYIVNIYYK